MTITIDPTNPCAAADQLMQVYTNLVAGQAAQVITFKSGPNGVDRSVTYQAGNAERLWQLITSYQRQCDISQGGRPRRRAVVTGGTSSRTCRRPFNGPLIPW